MPYVNPRVLDGGLAVLDTEVNEMNICDALPTTYAEATATFSLGSKTAVSVGAPANHSPTGRQVSVPAITGGTVDTAGTAGFYALVDTVASRLLYSDALAAPQVVAVGIPWASNGFDIFFPDPV